jgi:energy-coupling factor transporter ATP-binding protein EcfA2
MRLKLYLKERLAMFDFEAAIASASKDANSTALEALILGASGSGKSTLCGTLGCKTLYLYASGENHGVKAARSIGDKDVVPVCFDESKDFVPTTPDEALRNLLGILNDVALIKKHGFQAVVIDGASELEYLIRASAEWKKACTTAKGQHNGFEEPKATLNGFRPIVTALKNLQRQLGIHFAMTCILDVKEMGSNGEVVEASPRLQGYSVAESLVQQFGDVLVVGKMAKNNQIKYKLQFMTELTKTAKEENGTVKRSLNFSPRVAGVNVGPEGLPALMDADLEAVVELKKKHFPSEG